MAHPGAAGKPGRVFTPMKNFSNRYRISLLVLALGLILYLVSLKPVFLHSNGVFSRSFTHAAVVAVALRDAGAGNTDSDLQLSNITTPVSWGMVIEMPAGRRMEVTYHGETRQMAAIAVDEISGKDLLMNAGIQLAENEWLVVDGAPVESLDALLPVPAWIEVHPRVQVRIITAGREQQIAVSGFTVGDALWQAGIRWHASDSISPSPETLLDPSEGSPLVINIVPAQTLRVAVDGREISTIASGSTVGEVLAQAGISLNGLDYSLPMESSPVPGDGRIQVIRVREEFLREQEPIAFETKTEPADDLELDQQKWIQAGIPGILEKTVRIRLEDDVETARTAEEERVVLEPQTRILGYGTKIVIHTVDTPNGPVEYWRKLTVYATSYSPSKCAGCNGLGITFSGKHVDRGMIAMVRDWYYKFRGQTVYVPGYGTATVEDVGYPGPSFAPYWIDLFYLDEEWKSWHQYTTLYFLTPVPANPVYLLQ